MAEGILNVIRLQQKNPDKEFDLLTQIDYGTYGEMYKAQVKSSGEIVAVKILKLKADEEIDVVEQQIAILIHSQHPNIVALHGSYLRRDRLWVAMEYCGGGSVQGIIHATSKGLNELQIAFICRELLKGLEYLHKRNIIHRDIKGANILLTDDGEVKLADSGQSTQLTASLTKESFNSSPHWVAPEVAILLVESKGGYNQQCDIWSMGITAIELAETQPPMSDLLPMRALYLMTKRNFRSPTLQHKNKWSENFHDFLKFALQKEPKKRPTATELLKHIFVNRSALCSELTRPLLKAPSVEKDSDFEKKPLAADTMVGGPAMSVRVRYGEQEITVKNVQLFKNESLGAGSYGAVFKAKCDQLICAAKLLHPVLFQKETPDEPGKEHRQPFYRFEQECQILCRVNHPNIVQYLGTYRDPETNAPVLLMELMDESLTHFLESSPGDIPYHIQVNLSQDIAQALAFLHANGIIHRDLSSNNVLLIAGSRAKVSDFGMSKLANMNKKQLDTLTKCPGTPVFMSPEALDEPPVYTEKLDNFSFGVLLVQIVTRQFPAPTNRFEIERIPDRRNPARSVEARILIPEIERRQAHISLIELTHPLLPIALECLKDEAVERPSSQQLCQSLKDIITIPVRPMTTPTKEEGGKLCGSGNEGTSHEVTPPPPYTPPHDPSYQNIVSCASPTIATQQSTTTPTKEEGGKLCGSGNEGAPPKDPPPPPYTPPHDPSYKNGGFDESGGGPMYINSIQPPVPPRQHVTTPTQPHIPPLPPRSKLNDPSCGRKKSVSSSASGRAYFSKIFNGCPLHLNCSAAWTHPGTKKQYVMLGAEEGLFSLLVTDNPEPVLEQVSSRACHWLRVVESVLIRVSGYNRHISMTNLVLLFQGDASKPAKTRRSQSRRHTSASHTTRVPASNGTSHCCLITNPFTEQLYLVAAVPKGILLLQWYIPQQIFKQAFQCECQLPQPLSVFEAFIDDKEEYPSVCYGVKELADSTLFFETINLNTQANWYTDKPEGKDISILSLQQLEKDTFFVGLEHKAMFVDRQGRSKPSQLQASQLTFDEPSEKMVYLSNCVLSFNRHRIQGKSLVTQQVTADVCDKTKLFHLLGFHGTIIIETRPMADSSAPTNIYILKAEDTS